MDFVTAIVICGLVGLAAGALVRFRGRNSSFGLIHLHITLLVTLLLLAFFLFARLGLNIWSVTTIPILTLILTYLIIRGAIGKILQVRQSPRS